MENEKPEQNNSKKDDPSDRLRKLIQSQKEY